MMNLFPNLKTCQFEHLVMAVFDWLWSCVTEGQVMGMYKGDMVGSHQPDSDLSVLEH